MALQLTKTVYDDENAVDVEVNYHRIRTMACEFGGDDGTGITLQSWVDKDDFSDRGWNAPRGAFSFFFPHHQPDNVPDDAWAYQYIIDHVGVWSSATVIDD